MIRLFAELPAHYPYTNYAFYKGAVIPEPSTYAMVMAGLALAVVVVRRFRR